MEPVVQRAFEIVSVGVDLVREPAVKPGKHVIELQSVGSQVDPS